VPGSTIKEESGCKNFSGKNNSSSGGIQMSFLGRFWQAWKRVGKFIGDFIGRLVLTIFYFTIFLPFGLGVRILGDPLDMKSKRRIQWLERSTRDLSINDVRRLF
jgi:hypothetical protein